jgi:5-methylcytosine-specific restriction endonuclease McrA
MHERLTHNKQYDDPRHRALRARVLGRHVRRHGYVCPGNEQHDAHPSRDLTLDHVVMLRDGGALLDPANVRVLCRSANSAWRSATAGVG